MACLAEVESSACQSHTKHPERGSVSLQVPGWLSLVTMYISIYIYLYIPLQVRGPLSFLFWVKSFWGVTISVISLICHCWGFVTSMAMSHFPHIAKSCWFRFFSKEKAKKVLVFRKLWTLSPCSLLFASGERLLDHFNPTLTHLDFQPLHF